MPQTRPIISIENVVASAALQEKVELARIMRSFSEVQYHPDQFPGLVFRLKEPKTATLIFSSGKMVCTGAKSKDKAIMAITQLVRKLKKGGVPINSEPKVEIENIVASANLGGKVNLEQAARQLPRSMYEPEQFPGVIHRMNNPKTVILLFASGRLVCTGAKEEEDVYQAISSLHETLEKKDLMIY